MLGLELDSAETAKAVVLTLMRNKILINRTHETVLRFLPPYIIQEKHVDEVIRALDSALKSAASKQRRAVRHATNQAHAKENK
jgi:acetylornithine aminotransferase/acetylornithine/N-succinyldiaminopimelate aminotransferase